MPLLTDIFFLKASHLAVGWQGSLIIKSTDVMIKSTNLHRMHVIITNTTQAGRQMETEVQNRA